MKVKEESERDGLKFNIQKMKVMAFSPMTSWQIERETMETVIDFIFLGSKITADGDCSHEIKRHFLLGRKAMTNLDSILKGRDITLPTKVHLVKACVSWCESWTIKKAENLRWNKHTPFLVVVQLLSCVWLFVTLWTAAHQSSLSLTISQSLLKLMSI